MAVRLCSSPPMTRLSNWHGGHLNRRRDHLDRNGDHRAHGGALSGERDHQPLGLGHQPSGEVADHIGCGACDAMSAMRRCVQGYWRADEGTRVRHSRADCEPVVSATRRPSTESVVVGVGSDRDFC